MSVLSLAPPPDGWLLPPDAHLVMAELSQLVQSRRLAVVRPETVRETRTAWERVIAQGESGTMPCWQSFHVLLKASNRSPARDPLCLDRLLGLSVVEVYRTHFLEERRVEAVDDAQALFERLEGIASQGATTLQVVDRYLLQLRPGQWKRPGLKDLSRHVLQLAYLVRTLTAGPEEEGRCIELFTETCKEEDYWGWKGRVKGVTFAEWEEASRAERRGKVAELISRLGGCARQPVELVVHDCASHHGARMPHDRSLWIDGQRLYLSTAGFRLISEGELAGGSAAGLAAAALRDRVDEARGERLYQQTLIVEPRDTASVARPANFQEALCRVDLWPDPA